MIQITHHQCFFFSPCIFKVRAYLSVHIQRCHRSAQFQCTKCDKIFRTKPHLNRHLERHAGTIAKPFVCDVCGWAFETNASLQVCGICQFNSSLSSRDSLKILFNFLIVHKCSNICEFIPAKDHTHVATAQQDFAHIRRTANTRR